MIIIRITMDNQSDNNAERNANLPTADIDNTTTSEYDVSRSDGIMGATSFAYDLHEFLSNYDSSSSDIEILPDNYNSDTREDFLSDNNDDDEDEDADVAVIEVENNESEQRSSTRRHENNLVVDNDIDEDDDNVVTSSTRFDFFNSIFSLLSNRVSDDLEDLLSSSTTPRRIFRTRRCEIKTFTNDKKYLRSFCEIFNLSDYEQLEMGIKDFLQKEIDSKVDSEKMSLEEAKLAITKQLSLYVKRNFIVNCSEEIRSRNKNTTISFECAEPDSTKQQDIDSNNANTCNICYEPYDSYGFFSNCSHVVCYKCCLYFLLAQQFKSKSLLSQFQCPFCRIKFSKIFCITKLESSSSLSSSTPMSLEDEIITTNELLI